MLKINFNQLYYFYIVATEGSIKAATKKLHVTQPTISNQIKILEDSLGYEVFDREHRKLYVNERGKVLLEKAEKIFVLAENMIHDVTNLNEDQKNILRIGVQSSLPNIFTYKFCLKLWNDPSYELSIQHGSSEDLIDKLNSDDIDFILADTPPNQEPDRYECFNLGSQRMVAVASKKFQGLERKFPKSLQNQPYLAFTDQGQLQKEIDYYLKYNGVKPRRIGEVDDATLALIVVQKGFCFAFLSFSDVKESLEQEKIIKLSDLPEIKANFWLITTKIGSHNIGIRKAIENYKKNFQ